MKFGTIAPQLPLLSLGVDAQECTLSDTTCIRVKRNRQHQPDLAVFSLQIGDDRGQRKVDVRNIIHFISRPGGVVPNRATCPKLSSYEKNGV